MSKATRLTINDFNSLEDWMKYSNSQKNHGRFRYEVKVSHKDTERIKTMSYQKIVDSYKRNLRKKGIGKSHKIKGETMPTMLTRNSKCAKGWSNLNGMQEKESFKFFCIFAIT